MTRSLGIQGHRGARALFPENTLEGFRAAAALGVTAFELDVGLSADGVVVVSHDPALNSDIVRDASGAWLSGCGPTIRSLSHADLEGYDVGRLRPGSATAARFPDQVPRDGARIPTLAAVLGALPDCRFTVEVKTDPAHPDWTAPPHAMAEATVAVIDAAGAAGRVIVEAFDWRVQRHIRRSRPDLTLAWLTRAETVRNAALWWGRAHTSLSLAAEVLFESSPPASGSAEGAPVWAPEHTTLTEAEIEEAHRLDLLVLPWTVNDPEDMRRLVDWGVDGLISDRPDLALVHAIR
jgi:glycerophosphoryl diester phosphodiesterase